MGRGEGQQGERGGSNREDKDEREGNTMGKESVKIE